MLADVAVRADLETEVHGRQGGNRWSGRTVLQILRNPLYVGERVHNGGTVEGVHEGIIDPTSLNEPGAPSRNGEPVSPRVARPRAGLGP